MGSARPHYSAIALDPRTSGAFGAGWSTRWHMRLTEEPQAGTALITLADGYQVRHGRNPDGSYAGPSGGTSTLAREVDGWVLRGTSGTTYHFNSTGLLTPIKDARHRRTVRPLPGPGLDLHLQR